MLRLIGWLFTLFFLFFFSISSVRAADLKSSYKFLLDASRQEDGFNQVPQEELCPHLHLLLESLDSDARSGVVFLKIFPQLYALLKKHPKSDKGFWGKDFSRVFTRFRVHQLRDFSFKLKSKYKKVYWFEAYRHCLLAQAYKAICDGKKLRLEEDDVYEQLKRESIPARKEKFDEFIDHTYGLLYSRKPSFEQKPLSLEDAQVQAMFLALETDHPLSIQMFEDMTPQLKKSWKGKNSVETLDRVIGIPSFFDTAKVVEVLEKPDVVLGSIFGSKQLDTSSLKSIDLPKGAVELLRRMNIYKRAERYATQPGVDVCLDDYLKEVNDSAFMKGALGQKSLSKGLDFYVFLTQLEIDVVEAWTIFINYFEDIYPLIQQLPDEVRIFFPTLFGSLSTHEAALFQRDKIIEKMRVQKRQSPQEDVHLAVVVFKGSFVEMLGHLMVSLKVNKEIEEQIKEKLKGELNGYYIKNLELISKRLEKMIENEKGDKENKEKKREIKIDSHLMLFLYSVYKQFPPSSVQFLVNEDLQFLVHDQLINKKSELQGLSNKLCFIFDIPQLGAFVMKTLKYVQDEYVKAPNKDNNLLTQAFIYHYASNMMKRATAISTILQKDFDLGIALEQKYLDAYITKLFELTDRPISQVNTDAQRLLYSGFDNPFDKLTRTAETHPIRHYIRFGRPTQFGTYLRARALYEGRYGTDKEDPFKRADMVGEDLLKVAADVNGSVALQGLADRMIESFKASSLKALVSLGRLPAMMAGSSLQAENARGWVIQRCFSAIDRLKKVPDSREKWLSDDALLVYSFLPYGLRPAWTFVLINYLSIKKHTEAVRSTSPLWKGKSEAVRGLFYDKPKVVSKYTECLCEFFGNYNDLSNEQALDLALIAASFAQFISKEYPSFYPSIDTKIKDTVSFALLTWARFIQAKDKEALEALRPYIKNPEDSDANWFPLSDVGHFLKFVTTKKLTTDAPVKVEVKAYVESAGISDLFITDLFNHIEIQALPKAACEGLDPVPGDTIFPTILLPSKTQRDFQMPVAQMRSLREKAVRGHKAIQSILQTRGDEAWWCAEAADLFEAFTFYDLYAAYVCVDFYSTLRGFFKSEAGITNNDFCGYAAVLRTHFDPMTMEEKVRELIKTFDDLLPTVTGEVETDYRFRIARLHLSRSKIFARFLSELREKGVAHGLDISNKVPDALNLHSIESIGSESANLLQFTSYLEHLWRMFQLVNEKYKPAIDFLKLNMGIFDGSDESLDVYMKGNKAPDGQPNAFMFALIKLGGLGGFPKDEKVGIKILRELRSQHTFYGGIADIILVSAFDEHNRQGDEAIHHMIETEPEFVKFMSQFKQPKSASSSSKEKKKKK